MPTPRNGSAPRVPGGGARSQKPVLLGLLEKVSDLGLAGRLWFLCNEFPAEAQVFHCAEALEQHLSPERPTVRCHRTKRSQESNESGVLVIDEKGCLVLAGIGAEQEPFLDLLPKCHPLGQVVRLVVGDN